MIANSIPDVEPLEINPRLAKRVEEELGENVYLCYQCAKCSSGCPVAEFFDWQPNQIMRAVQLGQEELAFHSDTPWLCAACQTCTTRCPQGLDISSIMDFLTREALARGFEPAIPEIKVFNEAFLREVRVWKRSYELGMVAEMKLRLPAHLWDDVDLYVKMLRKGKVKLLPEISRPGKRAKRSPEAAEAVAYYPGCSLHSTATEFNTSTQAVCEALELDLVNPPNWVCCGSSAAHRADPDQAFMLPMVNLAQIEQMGFSEVTMPCAACYNRHKAAQFENRHDAKSRREAETGLGYAYQDTVRVNSLIGTLEGRIGFERIAERVTNPLEGLKVVCYYGCLLTRPPEVTEADNPENPVNMDHLITALGAEVLDWSYKTTCCGAAHSLTRPDIVLKLSGKLVKQARKAGADAIAVACPLCHTNLDARQFQMDLADPLPVLFFTQLMAVAFGLGRAQAALHKNLVDPVPVLARYGLTAKNGSPSRLAGEAEEEEEPISPKLIRPRAPPQSASTSIEIAEAEEDIFAVLDWIWRDVSHSHDVLSERPSLGQLFDAVDLGSPVKAAEMVIANMLLEVIQQVDRFSPSYKKPASAFGLTSSRVRYDRNLRWILSPEGVRCWGTHIQKLASLIRKDVGFIVVSMYLQGQDPDEGGNLKLIKVRCSCIPPRYLLMPAPLMDRHKIICEECGSKFFRA
jgi:heterodisulfide reductase subunit B